MSHHHCHDDSCSTHGHRSHGSCSCSCCGHPCPCCSSKQHSCGAGCHHHGDNQDLKDFASQLLSAADEAWMDVLKDKIRQHVEAASGKNLDKLAKLVVESNKNRWKNKMANQKGVKDFKDHVSEFFIHEK